MIDLKVTDAMISLVRSALRGDCGVSLKDAEAIKSNMVDIYQIAKRNDIAHIVGYALEKHELISPEDSGFAQFQKQQYLAMYRCEGMEYEIARMRSLFENEKIDFILLKGSVIRELYPEGWMRTSSDIDILVRPEDFDRAEEALINKLSYKKGMIGDHDHSLHSEGGVHIELHFTLLEEDKANQARDVLTEVWNYAYPVEEGKCEHHLTEAMFYFYHIAHLAKHVEVAGAGIRPFIDLWLINKNEEKNIAARKELLKRCSLDRFANLCDELAAHWMEEDQPLSEIGKRFEIFILNCGIYGSEENRIAVSKNDGKGTVGYVFGRLFLSHSTLKRLYPIIERHRWLTPFCQMARWFKLLTGEKTKKAIEEIKISSSTSAEDVNDLQVFLGDIGLKEIKK